jgi:hypothetical protein
MEIKNGKKPIASKPKTMSPTSLDDIFGNTLAVSPEIARAIASKGNEYRWISFTKYTQMGNSHERAWRPVKRSECGMIDPTSLQNGSDVDGYIRRGDLVLAVRPKELGDKHRSILKADANRAKNVQKNHADELRQFVRQAGINAKISEGYENDGEES